MRDEVISKIVDIAIVPISLIWHRDQPKYQTKSRYI